MSEMILAFLEGGLRVVFISLPLLLLLLVYPDLTKREKTSAIRGEDIPIYDFMTPEKRHPNFNRWLCVYFCCYIFLHLSYFYKCYPTVGLGEFVINIFLSFIFVGDFILGLVGLGEWASMPRSTLCFQ